ncbi:microfibril-associated glycoprotein 4-like [Anopheles funestus]|uniref:microfibril-associated glycoprotein 4-like n=1 Tax=Anopheles funestus TaxID=62324 RepID=UPI0020C6841D|nr:microfibril-associated glycoprotein 4-like [Anopheles funestus]
MANWSIVLLALSAGVIAIDNPPNNPPFPLKEAEFQILGRIEHLSRIFNDKIKLLNERVDEMKHDINGVLLLQNETNEMFTTTKKLLEKISDKIQSFSTSATQRMKNLEHKHGRFTEDTGVYFMKPDMAKNITFEVSRDWTNNHGFGGNWIVFQRRFNGSVDFYRNWTDYKNGFGDLRGEHFIGLEKLYAILKTRQHELLIVLEDFDGVIAYAHYDDFKIGDESEKYMIKSVGQYTGTAGDSFSFHKDGLFSTYDQNNDKSTYNCGQLYVGAWWFKSCYDSHLNGEYLHGKSNRHAGIIWFRFRGLSYSLKRTKMMVKPVGT